MYGWGKGALSHTTLVVSLQHSVSSQGEYPVWYLFLIMCQCPLTQWIQFPKQCCFIYTIKIGTFGAVPSDPVWSKASLCVCVLWHQREKASIVYSLFKTTSHCFPPLPLCSHLQWLEMQKTFYGTLLCHSIQTYFSDRAMQKNRRKYQFSGCK